MQEWDLQYYLHIFRQLCQSQGLPQLKYPDRDYFTQIARFDPAKGIPDLIKSYARFRELSKDKPQDKVEQLVICGHSSIDDPDGSMIYDQTMDTIHKYHSDIEDDIIVVRLGPSDQILNAILSLAKVALQLSTREGFEVKVSEALHKVRLAEFRSHVTNISRVNLSLPPVQAEYLFRSKTRRVVSSLIGVIMNLWPSISITWSTTVSSTTA
jgi:glycosyltransferase involved in cell wall biosynthesis